MATIPKKVKVASNPKRPAAQKKGGHMKNATKKKAAGKKKNPARKPKRRNPGTLGAVLGSPKELITSGVAGLASAVATRQLPQMILGAANTGWEGYLANLATAGVSAWLAGTFAGPAAGKGALVGGLVIVLDRFLTDQVSPLGPYLQLSGVGDATAYSKLGTIRNGYFTRPAIQNADGSMYIPDPYTDQAVQAVLAKYPQIAAPMAQAMAGRMGAVNPSSLRRHTAAGSVLSSRFQGRFNQ